MQRVILAYTIVSFKHKGLEQFFLKGDGSKLPAAYLGRIRFVLAALHAATALTDLNAPSFGLHPLKRKLKGYWSIKVSGNYRIIFGFVASKIEVIDVDYIDYH